MLDSGYWMIDAEVEVKVDVDVDVDDVGSWCKKFSKENGGSNASRKRFD